MRSKQPSLKARQFIVYIRKVTKDFRTLQGSAVYQTYRDIYTKMQISTLFEVKLLNILSIFLLLFLSFNAVLRK